MRRIERTSVERCRKVSVRSVQLYKIQVDWYLSMVAKVPTVVIRKR